MNYQTRKSQKGWYMMVHHKKNMKRNTASDNEILEKVVHDVKIKKRENDEAHLQDPPSKKSKKMNL
jgi:hypothetical protein